MSKIAKKTISIFLTVFIAMTFLFFIIRMTPGDPVELIAGSHANRMELTTIRHQLGLDQSLIVQYGCFLKNILIGNLGQSLFLKKSVVELIKERMLVSFLLAFCAVFISAIIGVTSGVVAGFYKRKFFDRSIQLMALVALACPLFSMGPFLVYIFAIKLKMLPVSEWGGPSHFILPLVTLVIPLSAIVMRVTRNKFLEEFQSPWVLVIRAKGLSELSVVIRILKVCLPSILTILSIQLSSVIAGTVIVETLFDIPGIGTLLFEGIQNRDYPVVQGVVAYSTLCSLLIFLIFETLSEYFDPRIKGHEN